MVSRAVRSGLVLKYPGLSDMLAPVCANYVMQACTPLLKYLQIGQVKDTLGILALEPSDIACPC